MGSYASSEVYIEGSPGDLGSVWVEEYELDVIGRGPRPKRFGGFSSGGAVAGAGGAWRGNGGETGPEGMSMVGWPFFDLKPITDASVLNFLDCLVDPAERRDLSSNMPTLGLALAGVVGVVGELAGRYDEAEGILELAGRVHHCCFAC